MLSKDENDINYPYEEKIFLLFSGINYNEKINEEEFEFYYDKTFKNNQPLIKEDPIIKENYNKEPLICPIIFNKVNIIIEDEEDEIIENENNFVIEIKDKMKEKIEEKIEEKIKEKNEEKMKEKNEEKYNLNETKKNEKPSKFYIFNEGSGKFFLNKKRFIIDEKEEITDIKSNNSDNLSFDSEKHIKKGKKKRKFKPDDIRKKIKSRFHKTLKNIINNKLKIAGSQKFFDFLPQSFISNISRGKNKIALEMTYKEILLTNFFKETNIEVDLKKYEKNLKVLEYLNENEDIQRKSNFINICSLTYKEILNEYFFSKEFEDSVEQLKKENEKQKYIEQYIAKSESYIEFFEN